MILKSTSANMSVLFNPYIRFSERQLILTGILLLLIGSLLGYIFHARFDGVLDLHFVEKVALTQPFLDNIIVIASLFVCLLAVGKYTNKKTRPIDILALSLISRIPTYLLVFANANDFMYTISNTVLQQFQNGNLNIAPTDLTIIVVFSILSIAELVWMCTLLYNGFKVATNAKKTRTIILFIVAIISAEILSKLIFSIL